MLHPMPVVHLRRK